MIGIETMSSKKNRFEGIWLTNNGTLVKIAARTFNDDIMFGRILKSNVTTVWKTDGNHLDNEGLNLVIKKRDEENWEDQ